MCLCVLVCAYACVNVPPLGDEPFITTAFIRPGLLVDRWEGRTALELLPHSTSNLTFQRSHFICHPQAPSWCITVTPGLRHAFLNPPPKKKNLSQTTNHPHHTGCSCSCTPLLQRPLTSYFQPFLWVRPPHFLYASVYPISQDASPPPTPPPTSFLVMNDRWSSHWQLGSWCHIITVSPFRQNYQITPVLKRLGRLTG